MVTAKYKLNTMKISISLNGYGKRNVCPFSFPSRRVYSRKVTFSRVNSLPKVIGKTCRDFKSSTRRTDQISWPFHFRQSLTVVERLFWQFVGRVLVAVVKRKAEVGVLKRNGVLYKPICKLDHDR